MKRCLLALVTLGMFACGSEAKNPVVVIETSHGTIKVELFEDKAPITVKNFLAYVDDKHYDDTVFHRVISDFMLQGGNFKKGVNAAKSEKDALTYQKKTNDEIKNESDNGLSNKKYTLAMARTSKPNSATDQFFINVKDNDFLDKAKARDKVGYAVFGKVIEGGDVVEKIKKVKVKEGTISEAQPVEEVVIKSVRREAKK